MSSKSDEKFLQQSRILEGINKILREAVVSETAADVAKKGLAVSQELTNSKFGFIGEINEIGRHDTIALSDPGWKECEIPSSNAVKLIKNMEIRGIWGQVIKNERSIIVNNPATHPAAVGVPKGHPKLTSFLGVPLKRANKIVGMIALANKESGYDLKDQESIETLSVAFVEALYAKKAEENRKKSEIQLDQLNQIFSNIKDTIFVISRDYKILFKNEIAQNLFGTDLIGRHCYEVIKGVKQPCERCPIKIIVESNICQVRFEQCVIFPNINEAKFFDIVMSPIENYGGQRAFVELLRDSTENRKLREDLNDKIKELNCLFGISKIIEEKNTNLQDIMKKTVEILPSAYKYPEITCARINFKGEDYKTNNFKETDWKLSSDIKLQESKVGIAEICYLEEKPQMDEGPFLKEERELTNTITERFGKIIERFYAEAEVTEQKEWLQVTLSSIGDAVIATDVDSNIIFMNSVAEKLTGWEIQEAKSKNINNIFKIYNEKTGKSAENPVKRVIREGIVIGLANHTILISKDGSKRNIEDSGAPIIDKDNKIIGVVLVFRDVTEEYSLRNVIEQSKKELETLNEQLEQKVEEKTKDLVKIMDELKKSEEKYRTTLINLDEGFYNVTLQGILLDHNRRFNEILGFDPSKDLTGIQLPDFWQNSAEREPYKQELIKNKFIKNYIIKAKKQNGEGLIVSANSHIIFDNNGAPIRIEGTFVDRTKEYFLEQDLKIQNQISNVFLTVPDDEMYNEVLKIVLNAMKSKFGVFGYIDENGALVVPSMTRHIWDQCQVPEKKFIFPKETWKDSIWSRVIKQKKILYSNERSILTPEGHIAIDRNISAPIIHQGEVIGLFQVANKETNYDERDIDTLKNIINQIAPILNARLQRDLQEKKRKFAEEGLKITLEDLKRSNAELEQFAYVASHDLQEPLRMVASFTQLLARRYKDKLDNDAKDFINFAVDGAIRMQNLINDLLTFSRVGTRGKLFVPTDANVILKTVLNNLRTQIDETKAKISYDPLPVIIADDSQMVQLFQNLISNAIKFHRKDVDPEVHISAEVKKDEWVFIVKDNGIGIDHQFFDRLFVIFQRLHRKDEYGGTGIGLAVCKKIVQRHGGKIWIESEPERGSLFYFSIPKREIVYNQQGILNK